jgi:hypothetical protein
MYKNCMLLNNVRSDECILIFFFCSSCAAKVDGNNKEVFSLFFFAGETGNTGAAAGGAKDLVGNCNGFFSKASGAGAKDLFGNSIGLVSSET